MYYRHVDEAFCLFKSEKDADLFLAQMNSMHPSLKFIVERESNHRLPFLDVFVHKTPTASHLCILEAHLFWSIY